MQRRPRIAVWGHFHGGNLGDELVVDVIVNAIRQRLPDVDVVAISMSPPDTLARHGVRAYPINPVVGGRSADQRRTPGGRYVAGAVRRVTPVIRELPFLWHAYRLLRSVDLVIVAGSGQLLDEWRGPWLHPYTTFRWAMLARMAHVPMLYPSVGAGPIQSRLSAFFIRRAVTAADYVSVRDGHSREVLTAIGVTRPIPTFPDMGYGLSRDALPGVRDEGERARRDLVVGVNVVAHQDPRYWPRGQAARFETFLEKMAAFTEWVLSQGYAVRLFSSQARADSRVADDLVELLERRGALDRGRLELCFEGIDDVSDLVAVVAGCDVVVAGRYHATLLPLLLDVPVLGLAYNPKTTELLTQAGVPEHAFDIDSLSVDSLIETFRDLLLSGERRSLRRQELAASNRAAVERQFDSIFERWTRSPDRAETIAPNSLDRH